MPTLLNKAAVRSYMNPNVANINEWCGALNPDLNLIFSTGPADSQQYLSRYNFGDGTLLDYADITDTWNASPSFQGSWFLDPEGNPWSPANNTYALAQFLAGTPWTLGETWGAGGSVPTGLPETANAAWLKVGNASYIVGSIFPGSGGREVWVANGTPGTLGFWGHVFAPSPNSGGSTHVCAGPQSPTSATAYWTTEPFGIYGNSFALGQTVISADAYTYDPGTWPTTNPGIVSALTKIYAPTDFDAGWSTIGGLNGPAYDSTDGNLIVQVERGTGTGNQYYICKLNAADGTIRWKVPVVNGNGFDSSAVCSSVIRYGWFYYFASGGSFGPGTLYQISTSDGTTSTYSLFAASDGVTALGSQVSNDAVGAIIGNATWNETGNYVTLLNSTPSSGSSLAAVYFFGSAQPSPQGGCVTFSRTWGLFSGTV
jgi:hypothetical protein